MGGLILVTGAGGYLGRAVVSQAVSAGHDVRAHLRSGTTAGVEVIRGDLADLTPDSLTGVTSVVHCAARLSGTDEEHTRDTVAATAHLAELSAAAGVHRFVLAGSMSVYTGDLPLNTRVDEDTPLERQSGRRDSYTRAKLEQERAAVTARGDMGLWLLRLGAIWGPGRLWNGHLGVAAGPALLRVGKAGEIPLLHLDNAATAIVAAAERDPNGVEILNVVDDDRPNRARYVRALRPSGWPRLVVGVPYGALDAIAGLGLPGPGLLRRPVVRARLRPLTYTNTRAKARLDWHPTGRFEALMEASR